MNLGELLWSNQRQIAASIVRNGCTAVKSSHDHREESRSSRIVSWWLDTHERLATTAAPTTKQVHAILWRYIGQAHREGQLRGRITLDDEWYIWVLQATSSSPLVANPLITTRLHSRASMH